MKSSGFKTPQWKVEAMRAMYAEGEKPSTIGIQLRVDETTIRHYCADIRPPKPKPMTAAERHRLLVGWR